MEKKKCNRCSIIKNISEFHKNKYMCDGLQTRCSACRSEVYHASDKSLKRRYDANRYQNDKENWSIIRKKHYEDNKEVYAIYNRKYYEDNKESCNMRSKKYRLNNKEKLSEISKLYYGSVAKYKLFYEKLTIDELPRLNNDNLSLDVLCRYCGKYFMPTNGAVEHRVGALSGRLPGDNYLYCSDNCKQACPTFHQIKYPKGFKKASSREVNSLIRQMCFKRDNWECQICGKNINEVQLHCHHIEGYTQNPGLGNDIDNVVTLCKECHKEVHKLPGCNYYDLRCKAE